MTSQDAQKGPHGLVSGRPGPVRAKVRAMLAESRKVRVFSAEDEVRAALAEVFAGAVDRATAAGDIGRVLAAGPKLVEVLDTLPVRRITGEEDETSDGGDPRAKLYAVMDGPPAVGDSAHA